MFTVTPNWIILSVNLPLGPIAQLGERVVRNDEAGGSIPPGSTITIQLPLIFQKKCFSEPE